MNSHRTYLWLLPHWWRNQAQLKWTSVTIYGNFQTRGMEEWIVGSIFGVPIWLLKFIQKPFLLMHLVCLIQCLWRTWYSGATVGVALVLRGYGAVSERDSWNNWLFVGHFNGNYVVVMTVTALRYIHVTINMHSHWSKPVYCVFIAISHSQYTMQLFWSEHWTLQEILIIW